MLSIRKALKYLRTDLRRIFSLAAFIIYFVPNQVDAQFYIVAGAEARLLASSSVQLDAAVKGSGPGKSIVHYSPQLGVAYRFSGQFDFSVHGSYYDVGKLEYDVGGVVPHLVIRQYRSIDFNLAASKEMDSGLCLGFGLRVLQSLGSGYKSIHGSTLPDDVYPKEVAEGIPYERFNDSDILPQVLVGFRWRRYSVKHSLFAPVKFLSRRGRRGLMPSIGATLSLNVILGGYRRAFKLS